MTTCVKLLKSKLGWWLLNFIIFIHTGWLDLIVLVFKTVFYFFIWLLLFFFTTHLIDDQVWVYLIAKNLILHSMAFLFDHINDLLKCLVSVWSLKEWIDYLQGLERHCINCHQHINRPQWIYIYLNVFYFVLLSLLFNGVILWVVLVSVL